MIFPVFGAVLISFLSCKGLNQLDWGGGQSGLHVRTFDDAKKPKHNNAIPVGMPDVVVDVSNG